MKNLYLALRNVGSTLTISMAALGFQGMANAASLTDDFPGSSVNTSIWTPANSGGALAPSVGGGDLTLDVTSPSSNQRSFVQSNDSDFNFFSSTLSATVTVSAIGGSSSDSNTADRFLMITDAGGGDPGYLNTAAGRATFVSLANRNGAEHVVVGSINGGIITETSDVTYTGTIASYTWDIDNAGYSLSFTGSGDLPSTISGSWSGIAEGDFSGGNFFVSLGVSNRGTIDVGSSASYGSISVIPEPASVMLPVAALVFVFVRMNHKRKGKA
ncbi:hypothetical protein [Rubellicoccus peritrichatus]|uniref:PEP-CTERM protein-sorting domain-containing protein n=1 Tax=Rubellicoccus peritrichatus TaxID=3080537 RepID=A0AAQ3QVT3_9BACT|nr:hypothetical protein [Puniceicoccus sp. CR14]WOO43666.1 hypothetical protein RZN69_11250 [Puniceicoccus sp. CR14]